MVPSIGSPAPEVREDVMRIALDARKLNGAESGIGNYILNLSKALLAEVRDLELVLVRNGSRRHLIDSPRVSDVFVPLPADSPLTPLALGYFLRRRAFDVFHSPFDHSPRGLGRPLVVTIHDLNWMVDPGYNSQNAFIRLAGGAFYRSSLMSSMRQASRILAVSNATRNAILEYAPSHEAKVRVTYNGADHSRIFPLDREEAWRTVAGLLAPNTPFVLTIGQGAPYKNHLNAVRCFLHAFRDRPEYRMVLVRRQSVADTALEKLLQS